MIRKIQRAALVLGLGLATSSFAADPLPGMWSFDGELTGRPGRGFQIDVQEGNLLILSYFGYRTDGSSLFMQASGFRQGSEFEADLVEYRGGTVVGGSHQDGETAQVLGRVKATFDTSTSGSIALPGEPPKPVRRFRFEDHSARFNNQFQYMTYQARRAGYGYEYALMSAKDGLFSMIVSASPNRSRCVYSGTYELSGNGIRSNGTKTCDDPLSAPVPYRAENMVVDNNGFYTATFYEDHENYSIVFFHQGSCWAPSSSAVGTGVRCLHSLD